MIKDQKVALQKNLITCIVTSVKCYTVEKRGPSLPTNQKTVTPISYHVSSITIYHCHFYVIDVFTVDYNRVIVEKINHSSSDYINASYISVSLHADCVAVTLHSYVAILFTGNGTT